MLYVSSAEKIWLLRAFFKAAVNYDMRVVASLSPNQCTFHLAQSDPISALILRSNVFFQEYLPLSKAVQFDQKQIHNLLHKLKPYARSLRVTIDIENHIATWTVDTTCCVVHTRVMCAPYDMALVLHHCDNMVVLNEQVSRKLQEFKDLEIKIRCENHEVRINGYKMGHKLNELVLPTNTELVRYVHSLKVPPKLEMGPPSCLLAAKLSARLKRSLQVRRGTESGLVFSEWGVQDLGVKVLDGRFKDPQIGEEKELESDQAFEVIKKRIRPSLII